MKVRLKDLKPNRTRDMQVDPIDKARVRQLTKAIEEEGFWGGVVCAPDGSGGYETLAGHHRIEAAIAAGITEADVFVIVDADDARRQHIYALENSTQRGSEGTAQAGSVASAVFVLAKALTRDSGAVIQGLSRHAWNQARNSFQNGKGIGRDLILKQLDGVPGITEYVVGAQIANLKASGDYDRVVSAAVATVRAEEPDLPPEVEERIEKVTARAASKPDPTFDFAGVSKHLTTPDHVATFRKIVTKPGIKEILPVKAQAGLAREIVQTAKKADKEISRTTIREQITALAADAKRQARTHDQRQAAEAARIASIESRLVEAAVQLRGRLAQVERAAKDIDNLLNTWPKNRPWPFDVSELRRAMAGARDALNSAIGGRR